MGVLHLKGLQARVLVDRDRWGVGHVTAENEHDAFFAQGFVAAQDRLWQMEYDRRRACGRWAEIVGRAGLAGDRLARRLQLVRSAKADVAGMSVETRAMFEAYADGVNAFIQAALSATEDAAAKAARAEAIAARGGVAEEEECVLPPEFGVAGIEPEPWEAWHSCALFKIRHTLMGVMPKKLTQAQILARVGVEAYGKLDGRPPVGSAVILPPGGAVTRAFEVGADSLREAAKDLGFLAVSEGGSNSWAVHGSLTTTGMPVLCNDSHRSLDVPSVYWQVHVSCPEFNAIGATFPGLPGFPHFGHNGHVAWNITHTAADYQDLYLERFDKAQAGRYQADDVAGGWLEAERSVERIKVANGPEEELDVWRTRHGPVFYGDPRRDDVAIAVRYTATEEPNRSWECFRPMLRAQTVAELHESQREWVEPVNNLVSADTSGNIGYLTRGYLPIRSSQAHRQFPAAGWTGENEWIGRVPFEQLPQAINPDAGFIATANQQVIPGDEPFISHDFSSPSRAERIRELILEGGERGVGGGHTKLTPGDIADWQGDVTSRPARAWAAFLGRVGPYDGDAEQARSFLARLNGTLRADSPPALLYGYFRRCVARAVFEPVVGPETWSWMTQMEDTTVHAVITRWIANVVASLPNASGETLTLSGRTWDDALREALTGAWSRAVEQCGSDVLAWRWGDRHGTNARHPMAAAFPDQAEARGWNPPRVPMGGDSDTIQAASYIWKDMPDFHVVGLSVYRQVVSLTSIDRASFVIPGGVSGVPGSEHYQDQLPLWALHERVPMHHDPTDVSRASASTSGLRPG